MVQAWLEEHLRDRRTEILSDLGCRTVSLEELSRLNVELSVLSDMETMVDNDIYGLKKLLGVDD